MEISAGMGMMVGPLIGEAIKEISLFLRMITVGTSVLVFTPMS